MNEAAGYAVFLYPQAVEALGAAIAPYLTQGEAGPHVLCQVADTGGAFVEMHLLRRDAAGTERTVELMVPSAMVRMVVSTHSDGAFGFGPRGAGDARAAERGVIPDEGGSPQA